MKTKVSFHAALRWLDRIEGVGVEIIRIREGFRLHDDVGLLLRICELYNTNAQAIQDSIAAMIPAHAHTGVYAVGNGAHLAMLDGVVTTVFGDSHVDSGVRRRRNSKKKQRVRNRSSNTGDTEMRQLRRHRNGGDMSHE